MQTQQSQQLDKDLLELEVATDSQRQSDLLKTLNISLIAANILALGVMFIPPTSDWWNFAIMSLFLTVNLSVFSFHRSGFVRLSAYLFCHSFNLAMFLGFVLNLLVFNLPSNAISFGSIMALSTLLSGMLIGTGAIITFSCLNAVLIFVSYYVFSDTLGDALAASFPVLFFLALIAIISWLYQRNLDRAHARVRLAQERLIHDAFARRDAEIARRDLALAREWQQRLYPGSPWVGRHFTIISRSAPARETSGDFFDFIEISEHELGIVIADVTGKSLAAAMVMAMARSTIRSEAYASTSPAEVLRNANQTLCRDESVKQLISAFYAILDTRTLTLRCSNAGQPFPMIQRASDSMHVEELDLGGFPLGAWTETHYEERVFQLLPGDRVLFFSDGVLEERNDARELFGFDRLRGTLCHTGDISPEHMVDHLWQSVERFRDSGEQSDDMTVVLLTINAAVAREQAMVETSTHDAVPDA